MTPRPSIARSIVICATPRSGSELLCEALRLSGAGRPEEYFRTWIGPGAIEPEAAAFEEVYRLGTDDNGIFSAKIMWDQLGTVANALRAITGIALDDPLRVLAAAWPRLTCIHLSRRDTVRQAVSWSKAIATGQWGTDPDRHVTPMYDPDQIAWCFQTILQHERAWSSAFMTAGIVPHGVSYEDLAGSYQSTVNQLMHSLELRGPDPAVFLERSLKPQADTTNDEWVARFRATLSK